MTDSEAFAVYIVLDRLIPRSPRMQAKYDEARKHIDEIARVALGGSSPTKTEQKSG